MPAWRDDLSFHLTGRYIETKAGAELPSPSEASELGAKTATLLVDGQEQEVPIRQVRLATLCWAAGGRSPPTGSLKKESAIDESMATGSPCR